MKVVVLGASGRTGACVLDEALAAGYSVTAIVRTPSKVTKKHANLQLVQASVFSSEELTAAFKDHDAVVSVLGFSRTLGFSFRAEGYSESMRAIVAAMRATNISRLVVMTAYYTDLTSGRGVMYNWFIIPMIKEVLKDMKVMEDWLMTEVQDIDWTVARPGILTNRAKLDQVPLQEEGAQFVADAKASTAIPRANVAAFIISQVQETDHTRKVVAIAVQ